MASSTSNTISPTHPLGTLSTLPFELRNQILDLLTPSANPSSPFSASKALADRIGVGAVSHVPPPTSLLLTCKQLSHEALDVYYRKTVFSIERVLDLFSPWSMMGVEETLGRGRGAVVLGRMRRVRVDVFWEWLPTPAPAPGLASSVLGGVDGLLCPRESEIMCRMERMGRVMDVLVQAAQLQFFCLGWKECAPLRVGGDEAGFLWEAEARKRVLGPVKRLRGVRVVEGEVVAGREVEEVIGGFLGEVRREMREREERKERKVDGEKVILEEKKRPAKLVTGERKHLLTPEDREMHRRKRSYFE
ncbi:hypothetical protein Vi05172_g11097 [Venturia inaequalis]|uniref:Uncharacterized protein n=1 Tax=Venturia inaequalis TaxID=5025 RepID=A0A8H3VJD1_VENIN|nr:hypothetical protein EG327_003544 [Venturia inaequalis]RDI78942.1 hypothetical protein Vi05172_g11097 [Venturia inaequalis]